MALFNRSTTATAFQFRAGFVRMIVGWCVITVPAAATVTKQVHADERDDQCEKQPVLCDEVHTYPVRDRCSPTTLRSHCPCECIRAATRQASVM